MAYLRVNLTLRDIELDAKEIPLDAVVKGAKGWGFKEIVGCTNYTKMTALVEPEKYTSDELEKLKKALLAALDT